MQLWSTEYFRIKKGRHFKSGLHFGITFSDILNASGTFEESAYYDLKNVDNYDINKLFGFSSFLNPHKSSARVGWRCLDGKLQLLAYVDEEGIAKTYDDWVLGNVSPGEKWHGFVQDAGDSWFIGVSTDLGLHYTTKRIPKAHPMKRFRFYLFPYFGGNQTAPHDIRLSLKFKGFTLLSL